MERLQAGVISQQVAPGEQLHPVSSYVYESKTVKDVFFSGFTFFLRDIIRCF